MATPSHPLSPDLVASARAFGPGAVELVVDAYQRGRREEGERVRSQAVEACRQERRQLDDEFVRLEGEAQAALEARFEEMSPSPIIAAYYEGAANSVDACIERMLALTDEDGAGAH